jgi:hypothetical protein
MSEVLSMEPIGLLIPIIEAKFPQFPKNPQNTAPLARIAEEFLVRIDSYRIAYHFQYRYVLNSVTI